MLYRLNTKTDVLALLYALGEGLGLPFKAVEPLSPFIEFLPDHSICDQLALPLDAATGNTGEDEESEDCSLKMAFNSPMHRYEPQLDDFQVKFALPAVAYAHFEDSFDRSGDVTIAFFDFQPLETLSVPRRFLARARLVDFCNLVRAEDLGAPFETYADNGAWLNGASEEDVRAALGAQVGLDLSSDEALQPYLSSYATEYALFQVFLRDEGLEKLTQRMARVAQIKGNRWLGIHPADASLPNLL